VVAPLVRSGAGERTLAHPRIHVDLEWFAPANDPVREIRQILTSAQRSLYSAVGRHTV
jgi:hypothetical protein